VPRTAIVPGLVLALALALALSRPLACAGADSDALLQADGAQALASTGTEAAPDADALPPSTDIKALPTAAAGDAPPSPAGEGRHPLAAAALGPGPGEACEPVVDPAELRTFILYFENDTFAGSDDQYTNAVRLTYLSKDLDRYEQSWLPRWAVDLLGLIPRPRGDQGVHNVGLSIGQSIYTPEDTQAEVLQKDDRPYAGWLYGAVALHAKNETRLDSFEIAAGVVGPAALGEEAQNGVHSIRRLDTAKGWENQLENEPGVALTWRAVWREVQTQRADWESDFLPHLGVTLGNVAAFASAGFEARWGPVVPNDFGTNQIKPGGIATTPSAPGCGPAALGGFTWHLFTGLDMRAVARDIFLDGNSFEDSHRVDKIPLVADVNAGAAAEWKMWKLTYSYVYRTPEFTDQESQQVFGSLTVSRFF